MEMKRAKRFRREYCCDRFRGQVRQQTVIQHACQVKNALERTLQAGNAVGHFLFLGNVSVYNVDFGFKIEIGQAAGVLDPLRGATAVDFAVQKGNMTSPVNHQIRQ